MSVAVARTCTEVPEGELERSRNESSRTLEELRSTPAYVLLGDPGSGKSTAFETECSVLREDARLIPARDFLALSLEQHPEWRKKTLFIDGLDEVRSGSPDVRTPLDAIRGRLDALGTPRFRLSCRAADWLGVNDRRHLAAVSPNSKLIVLRLDPLAESDIVRILTAHQEIENPEEFIRSARAKGVGGFLTNPLTLDLLVRAVAPRGQWPEGRRETFEAACREMAREHNEEHQLARRPDLQDVPPDTGALLDAAGRLCAVSLISGVGGYALRDDQSGRDYPSVAECEHRRPQWLRQSLFTKLFTEVATDHFAPIHRHIAEFLAARHLARLVGDGLPVQRVLSLTTGEDGIVVSQQRGLSAWLAAHCREARGLLIEHDPIGVALYGDIREFSAANKRELLASLHREVSRRDLAFRAASAFGPLATPDIESEFRKLLLDPRRDASHQQFIAFVLCVLEHGTPLPNLANALLDIVRDGSWAPCMKELALRTFLHQVDRGAKRSAGSVLADLLEEIQSGSLPDPDREMLGSLLAHLYPDAIPLLESGTTWSKRTRHFH